MEAATSGSAGSAQELALQSLGQTVNQPEAHMRWKPLAPGAYPVLRPILPGAPGVSSHKLRYCVLQLLT